MNRAVTPEPVESDEPNDVGTSFAEPSAQIANTPDDITIKHQGWVKTHLRLILIVIIALIITGGASAFLVLSNHSKPVVSTQTHPVATATPVPSPVMATSPLTGLKVSPDVAKLPIVGVIIENQTDARPQSGLAQAGVVYEANAEGGITRFEAFFEDAIPAVMGPVRSLRTYFLDWGLEFNAPIAHAGGNADALDEVNPLGLKDINALYGGPSQFFYRSSDRYAPHNLYTNSSLLSKALAAYNFTPPSSFTPSPRQPDAPLASPTHPNIHINYSYTGYQVDYTYTPLTNDYARNLAAAPHIDRNTGAQIHVKNVVVEYMPTSYGKTRIGEDTVIMGTVGRGEGIVFRDGDAIPVTWVKASRTARTQLLDATGKDVALNAGNTWYSIVPVGNAVTY
jgi:hypothetical protein